MHHPTARLKRAARLALTTAATIAAIVVLCAAGFVTGWRSRPHDRAETEAAARAAVGRALPAGVRNEPQAPPHGGSDRDRMLADAQASLRFPGRLGLGDARAFAAVEALAPGDLPRAFADAVAQPRTASGDRLIDLILDRWSRTDASAAVDACAANFHSRDVFFNRARTPLYRLAETDPTAAFEAWTKHWQPLDEDHDNSTEYELTTVFGHWAKRDLSTASEAFRRALGSDALSPDELRHAVRGLTSWSTPENRDAVLALVQESGDPTLVTQARKTVVEGLVRSGQLEAASTWIDDLDAPPAELVPLEEQLASTWFQQDQPAAAAWIVARSNDDNRPARLKELVHDWADWEPNAAGEWLGTMVESYGSQADAAVGEFALAITDRDPASALEWIAAINDPAQRLDHAARVGREWGRRNPDRPIDPFFDRSSLGQAERTAFQQAAAQARP